MVGAIQASNDISTGCTRPRPGFAFYNASKAAVSVNYSFIPENYVEMAE